MHWHGHMMMCPMNDAMNQWLIHWKRPWCWDWRQKEKRATEDEMASSVGWHHRFKGHELGQTLGNGEGQGSLTCCSPWLHEELDMTWWLNEQSDVYHKCLQGQANGGSWGFLRGLRKGCYLLRSYRPASEEEKLIFLVEQVRLPLGAWLMHNTDARCTREETEEAQMRTKNSLCLSFSCLTYCTAHGTLLNALWWTAWEGSPKGGHVCMCVSDSFCCTVETNITS